MGVTTFPVGLDAGPTAEGGRRVWRAGVAHTLSPDESAAWRPTGGVPVGPAGRSLHARGLLQAVAPGARTVRFLRTHRLLPLLAVVPRSTPTLLHRPGQADATLARHLDTDVLDLWRVAPAMATLWDVCEMRTCLDRRRDPTVRDAEIPDTVVAGVLSGLIALLGARAGYLDSAGDRARAPLDPLDPWSDVVAPADLPAVARRLDRDPHPPVRPGWAWQDRTGYDRVVLTPAGPDAAMVLRRHPGTGVRGGDRVLVVPVEGVGLSSSAAADAFRRAAQALEQARGPAPVVGATQPGALARSPMLGSPYCRWPSGDGESLVLYAGPDGPELARIPDDVADAPLRTTSEPSGFLATTPDAPRVNGGERAGIGLYHPTWDLVADALGTFLTELPGATRALGMGLSLDVHADLDARRRPLFRIASGTVLELGLVAGHTPADPAAWSGAHPAPADDETPLAHRTRPVGCGDREGARRLARLLVDTARDLGVVTPEDLHLDRWRWTRHIGGTPVTRSYTLDLFGVGIGR